MTEIKNKQIKQLIIKYLLIIVGLAIFRGLLSEFVPSLFTNTIVGEGFTQSSPTFFNMYQLNFFNIIIGLIMSFDLYKTGQNWIVIPILTIISLTAGLFLFSILIINNLIIRHGRI